MKDTMETFDTYGKEPQTTKDNPGNLPGVYAQQLDYASQYLKERYFAEAMEIYDNLLQQYGTESDVLYGVSKDLVWHGYVEEMLLLIVPLYDWNKHDIRIGLNLLEGYLKTGNYQDGKQLLDQLMQLDGIDGTDATEQLDAFLEQLERLNRMSSIK